MWSERKFTEKLRNIHRNPVQRGLVARPEHWRWSSFRHYATGEESTVEIESIWTVRRRDRSGVFLTVVLRSPAEAPPKRSLNGAPSILWVGRATLLRANEPYGHSSAAGAGCASGRLALEQLSA